ncbi:MAG TPA: lysine-sensitive aspartokinase 3 [Blastocatellia bacterium]|jgi:aspartate kinase|nr:lysine-sensitive aspartokinase 3 [Blastocatellia bacterium]
MKPTIMKFGGTSVEGATAFQNAVRIVSERQALRPVVVVSAMAGFTDALLGSVQQALHADAASGAATLEKHFNRHSRVIDALLSNEAPRMRKLVDQSRGEIIELLQAIAAEAGQDHKRRKLFADAVASHGERLSAAMLAAVLVENKVSATDVDARRCIITDDEYGCAAPLIDETFRRTQEQLQPLIESSCVPVLGGFIGSTLTGETTTLGRGGSDYTAAIIGAALEAEEIQIWTDVPGVLTADPRLAPKARTVPQLSFEEAAELAYFGAKVLHPKTLHPAIERNIPVRICNSRAQESGSTLVVAETEKSPHTVKAIAHKTGVTTIQVTSARMLGAYGFLRALFEIFDRYRTAVDVVTTSEVSVSLSLDDISALPEIVRELEKLGSVSVEEKKAILCIVGEGLRSTPGIAARIFSTISDINVSLISQGASRINLTFAVEEARAREAVTRLHREFFESTDEGRPVSEDVTNNGQGAESAFDDVAV